MGYMSHKALAFRCIFAYNKDVGLRTAAQDNSGFTKSATGRWPRLRICVFGASYHRGRRGTPKDCKTGEQPPPRAAVPHGYGRGAEKTFYRGFTRMIADQEFGGRISRGSTFFRAEKREVTRALRNG